MIDAAIRCLFDLFMTLRVYPFSGKFILMLIQICLFLDFNFFRVLMGIFFERKERPKDLNFMNIYLHDHRKHKTTNNFDM